MPGFVQIMEIETSRIEEVEALSKKMRGSVARLQGHGHPRPGSGWPLLHHRRVRLLRTSDEELKRPRHQQVRPADGRIAGRTAPFL